VELPLRCHQLCRAEFTLFLAVLALRSWSGIAYADSSGGRVLFKDSIKEVPIGARFSEPHRVREKLTAEELSKPIDFVVSLRMRNFDELKTRIQSGQQVSQAVMEMRYLPTRGDYERVASWLKNQGLALTLIDSNHTDIFLRGTVRRISTVLGMKFARVATGDGEFTSAITVPSLPQEISEVVLGIDGLQPHLLMHVPKGRSDAFTSYDGYFTPADIAAAYNVPSGITGFGQTIAIIMAASPVGSDLGTFYEACGIADAYSTYYYIPISGGPTNASQSQNAREVALDTEWSTGMAPGAKLRVYETPNLNTSNVLAACTQILTDASADPTISVVSYSASGPESDDSPSAILADSQKFAQLAAAGITFLGSSGDGGSNPNPLSEANGYDPSNPLTVEYPASDPNLTGVGGTTVSLNSNWSVTGEIAWTPGALGTGGGVSGVFSRPSWQGGPGVPAGSMRCVPDVAAVSNANTNTTLNVGALVVVNGVFSGTSGTSLSAPVWAGLIAIVNQARSNLGLKPLGLLGPWIYPLIGSSAFRDITKGNNGAYGAGPGYDLCTGVGTPNLTNLITIIDEEITYTPPPSSPITAGSAVTMNATAQLSATYQWQLNGVSIPGATNSTYSIAKAGISDAGIYSVVITSTLGSFDYTLGTLTVYMAPTITVQPTSSILSQGNTATFIVVATGAPAPTYQWFFNGNPIAGATSATYTIAAVQPLNVGSYTVTVTNSLGAVTSNPATLTIAVLPTIITQPVSQTVKAGSSVTFSVMATGTSPTYQWNFNGEPISGANSATYAINNATVADVGSYTVTVTIAAGAITSHGGVLAVQASGAPAVTIEPQSQTIAAGATVALSVSSTGTVTMSSSHGGEARTEALASASYQWYLNGAAISGATSSTFLIQDVNAANAGNYVCLVSNANGSSLSSAAVLTVTATTNPGRLVNLSMLSNIQGSLSMGFVTGGTGTSGSEPLLIRAVGPSVGPGTAFNVSGVMIDPTLTVVQQTDHTKSYTDSGWGSNSAAVFAADSATGAFALTNTASADSALVANLPEVSGGYSATISGKSGDNGYALTEVYDDTPAYTPTNARLINLSCLTSIAVGGTLDVGFVVGGSTSKTVLVRVGGPALNALYGISGVMPDPQLLISPLGSSSTVVASDAGWGGNSQIVAIATSVGAYTWPNPTSLDSAALVTLPPGAYTVQVNGTSGDGGTVLVEIYDVP